MPSSRNSPVIVIAGASSLLGGEVKSLLEESKFAGWEVRLVDEEIAAGTLTEVGGEAALIQKIEEESFSGARFVFVAGSAKFARQVLAAAKASGATLIDFSRASLSDPDAVPWFPKLAELSGKTVPKDARVYSVFSTAGASLSAVALVARRFDLQRLSAVAFRPVSDSERAGVEELETQTSQLLSFQTIGNAVFGTQAAFNILPRYGEGGPDLSRSLLEIRAEITAAVGDADDDQKISLNVLHVPVFYGSTFTANVDLGPHATAEAFADALRAAGFTLVPNEEAGPSNVSVAGESTLAVTVPRADVVRAGSWWLFGAGDNLRVPAYNGIKLAEWLDG
jgi:aspartate-semialdehyde dehydrogenase